jgi:hypothetical protein
MRAARQALTAAARAATHGGSRSASGSAGTAGGLPVTVYNPSGGHRVVVTKDLPGSRWVDILVAANCRVEVRAWWLGKSSTRCGAALWDVAFCFLCLELIHSLLSRSLSHQTRASLARCARCQTPF